mmetsp:Transcript_151985/g.485710  ORF Transcript_151985/g.485710 Transcript_151985/m.485710 type:complete len:192 (-) Transcript_151985:197-772(-)
MSASVVMQTSASPVMSYSAGAPATYVTSYAAPQVTYAAPQAAYTLGSQMAMDWGAHGVPISSMAFPAGGSVSAAPMVAASAVYSCPPVIFAKLAAGGALTPVEMAQLTGQAPSEPAVPEVPAVVEAFAEALTSAKWPPSVLRQVASAPAAVAEAVVTSAKASKDKSASEKKSSKKKISRKASSKKSTKGCC